ncbi:MAG: DUF1830 domain-containing protein [Synechococcus sp.]|nr:DUF1830 domain-containing protein [Synechococcus sp.]
MELISCGYRNTSERMVIVRCCGPEQFYLERVVFPFELLSFHCPPQADVEIWTHGLGGPELLERLHGEDILIEQPLAATAASAGAPTMTLTTEPTPWLQAG